MPITTGGSQQRDGTCPDRSARLIGATAAVARTVGVARSLSM
jgi:hypothetical protein